MANRLKILISILILVLLYSIYYWVVPITVDIQDRAPSIENIAYKKLGIKLKIVNPKLKMGFLPSVWLKADEFSLLTNNNRDKNPLEINSPKIKIQLIPLLWGKVQVKYFSAENISAQMKFDKNMRFYLGNQLIIANANPKLSFENSQVYINEYSINLKDEYQNKYIKINGDYFDLYKFNPNKYIDLSADSKIAVNKNISKISANINCRMPFKKNFNGQDITFSGAITNLNLADFSPYIKKFTKNKIQKASGIINLESKTIKQKNGVNRIISGLSVKNISIEFRQKYSSVFCHDNLKINSILEVSNNKLNVIGFKVKAKGINASIKGQIRNIKRKNSKLNIDLIAKNSRSENIINLIPGLKIEDSQIDLIALKKYNFYSNINGKLSFRGSSKNPKIFGKVSANQAYVVKPIPGNVPKATIIIKFLGKDINMDINVPTGKQEFVKVLGLVELYGKHNSLIYVNSSKNVDLKTAESVLNPLHEIFYFQIGPVPVMDIHGIGNIVLKIKGNKLNPQIWGEFNFRNSSVSFNKIDALITNGNGHLLFNNKNTHFFTTSAYFKGKPISINGKCSLLGKFDFKVNSNNQNANNLINILKNSPMLKEISEDAKLIEKANGLVDLTLNITGQAKDVTAIQFNKNIFAKGTANLKGVDIKLNSLNIPIKHAFGTLSFDGSSLAADIHSILGKSDIFIKSKIKKSNVNIEVKSNSLYINDIICYAKKFDPSCTKEMASFSNSHIKLNAKYDGPIDFDIKKLHLDAFFLKPAAGKADLSIKNGKLTLKNGQLHLNHISGMFKNSKFIANGNVSGLLDKNPKINGTLYASNFDISLIKTLAKYPFIPVSTKKVINQFTNISGKQQIKLTIKNNNIHTKISLKGISFVYKKDNMPLKFYSGAAELSGTNLVLYRANAIADSMPILVDGTVHNIFTNPIYNIYINSKPTQKFIDKYVNKDSLYPIRIQGDTLYSARIKGNYNDLSVKAEINLAEDSYINYMGGSLGDNQNPIRIYFNSKVKKNHIEVYNFQYDKLVSSQNNQEFISPQLFAKGVITFSPKNVYLRDFRIITQNPTDAKIFNILFKKAIAKQGKFVSNLRVNGSIFNPQISGTLSFTGVDVPILDTTLRDINLGFKNDKIYVKASGDVLANKVEVDAIMKNSIAAPYILDNLDITCDNLNIDKLSKSISNFQDELEQRRISTEKQIFDIKDLIVKKATINAKNVFVKGIHANNFYSDLTLDDTMALNLNNFKFNIADGSVNGDFKYSFFNNRTDLNLNVSNANANELSKALFDLPDQLYGALSGNVNLYCNGKTHKSCMSTLNGLGGFEVKYGRMPKLGSMEYLLKAANLVKSGITGLTVNNVIGVITPLKTGEFDSIRGDFKISSGVAHPVEIYSKGKDLDLFIDGSYNFANSIADMNVFGRLSKKISTVLGPVGNASLNTLFNMIPGLHLDDPNNTEFINSINKIPGFELNDKMYRIFSAKIYGDITGENYVQSFKWVE